MVMAVTLVGGLGGFQVGLNAGKRLLRAGEVTGLQGGAQGLKIVVRLGVLAEGLSGGRLGTGLQSLLESRQSTLGGGEVAGLQCAADGLEIIDFLRQGILICGQVRVGRRGNAGDAAHSGVVRCVGALALTVVIGGFGEDFSDILRKQRWR